MKNIREIIGKILPCLLEGLAGILLPVNPSGINQEKLFLTKNKGLDSSLVPVSRPCAGVPKSNICGLAGKNQK